MFSIIISLFSFANSLNFAIHLDGNAVHDTGDKGSSDLKHFSPKFEINNLNYLRPSLILISIHLRCVCLLTLIFLLENNAPVVIKYI